MKRKSSISSQNYTYVPKRKLSKEHVNNSDLSWKKNKSYASNDFKEQMNDYRLSHAFKNYVQSKRQSGGNRKSKVRKRSRGSKKNRKSKSSRRKRTRKSRH